MRQHTTPTVTSTTTPWTLGIARGQSLWLCLPPGSALYIAQGEVSVRFTTGHCGHTAHTGPGAVLTAGGHWAWSDAGPAQACWAQIDNLVSQPAEIHVLESAPEPGWLRRAWRGLRGTLCKFGKLSKRGKADQNPAYGAMHAAQ